MRALVNGLLYDTEKAQTVAWSFHKTLYRTKKGNFFLHKRDGMEEQILPLSKEEVQKILKELELVANPEELGLPYEEA